MKYLKRTLIAALFALGFNTTASAQTWVESDGLVVIETEDAQLADGWAVRTQSSIESGDPRRLNGFTGRGFIEWVGEQTFGLQIDEEDANGLFDIKVRISTPGVYSLRWRNKQQAAGQARDAGNDTFLRFASGRNPAGAEDFGRLTKVFIQEMNEWTFFTRAEPRMVNGRGVFIDNDFRRFLGVGTHTIQLSGRSPGHVIDRIVLHREGINFNENIFVNTPQSRIIPDAPPAPVVRLPEIGDRITLRGSNRRFVSSEGGNRAMRCNRESVRSFEVFIVEDAGNGRIALRGNNGRFVSSENGSDDGMTCVRFSPTGTQTFRMEDSGNGSLTLRGSNGLFVSSEDGNRSMRCDRRRVGRQERFIWTVQ